MNSSSSSAGPIFIAGICQRSGTNFFYDLMRLHPDCGAPGTNWEDASLSRADSLVDYVKPVAAGWRRHGADAAVEDLLYEQLGNGVISALASQVKNKRLLTKAPSVRNIDYFFKLFPRAYLLILVRDGRAVTESRVKTFGESYEFAMRIWAGGADHILRFNQTVRAAHLNCLTVKYEELFANPKDELAKIFSFVGLAHDKYDFDAAINLPVRGSSVFRGKRPNDFHWEPLEKTAAFNPVERGSNWSRSTHERFNWIAGEKLTALGYEPKKFADDQKLLWSLRNKALDVKWRIKQAFKTFERIFKDALKSAFGTDRMSKYRRQVSSLLRAPSS